MSTAIIRKKPLTTRDRLQEARERLQIVKTDHAMALQRELTQDRQREAISRQRIADGIQRQQDQVAGLQELQHELKNTQRQLIALDEQALRDDALDLLRAQLLTTVQELSKQQLLTDALAVAERQHQGVVTDGQHFQQLLIDALAQLNRPKKVTLTRGPDGKVISGEVG